jgi:uncharacterized protein
MTPDPDLSTSSNQPGDQSPQEPPTEVSPPPEVQPVAKPEDPPWSGWDVLLLVAVTIGASFVLSIAVVTAARFSLYPHKSWMDVATIPELLLLSQLLAYVVVLVIMYRLLRVRTGKFWQSIQWNWPSSSWSGYVLGGAVVFLLLASVGRLLPIPKSLPIDRFFENARQAAIMSVFAVAIAPLMEELFFRGFLYPVLARRFGMIFSIVFTAVAFALLHGSQLQFSWAAVLIIFMVGIVLTTVRAVTRSVAASFLLHVGYNFSISAGLLLVTGGFRHLERLNR